MTVLVTAVLVAYHSLDGATSFYFYLTSVAITRPLGLYIWRTLIGTLAVDGWAVTFGTARRGLSGLRPHPVPSSLYQM